MAPTSDNAQPIDRFRGGSGAFAITLAGILAVVTTAAALVNGWQVADTVVLAFVGLIAVVVWVVYMRPEIAVSRTELIFRGMVTTTWIPLERIDDFRIRQIAVAHTGDKRYTSAAMGRGRRELMRNKDEIHDPKKNADTLVEHTIMHRVNEAKEATGGPRTSKNPSEQLPAGQLRDGAAPVRREVAWLEVALLVAMTALTVICLVVF